MNLTEQLAAQRMGSILHHGRQPVANCQNLEEVRGWVDAANVRYLIQTGATLADHARLVTLVETAVSEAQKK
jgi:hypothetical protein